MRQSPEAQPVKFGEIAEKVKAFGVSRNLEVVVRVLPAKPVMGLIRVVAPEFLVMNGLDQLRTSQRCLACTLQPAICSSDEAWVRAPPNTLAGSVLDVADGVLPS